MLSIARADLALTDLNSLHPGELFVYREGGHQRLAIALSRQGGKKTVWMNLTGKRAFEIEHEEFGAPSAAFVVPYPPEALQLRVDFLSEGAGAAAKGELVVGDTRPLAISAQWRSSDGEQLQALVTPASWELAGWNTPRLTFSRWALGVIDHSGAWVDVLTRTPTD